MKAATHKLGILICLCGLAPILSGCPEDGDDESGDESMPACGDLSSMFEMDRLTNGVSDWEESASPVCTFGVRNSSGGGVQVFTGGAADYESMVEGAQEFNLDVVETNSVGARSFEFDGIVGGWIDTAEIGFLDSTERFAVLVYISESMEEDVLDMVEAIAREVNDNLSAY